jgi:hypothetical protein
MNIPRVLKAGSDIPVSFDLSACDLEPWLGAWAHITVVSADRESFIHAHPLESTGLESNPLVHVHTTPLTGPSPQIIRTTLGFRNPGVYKLWFQFQRKGTVVTVPFILKVEPAEQIASKAISKAILNHVQFSIKVGSSGFEPARLTIPANQKTQVAFTRVDAQNCASEVVFPSLNLRAKLPPGETVLIDVPATPKGEFAFACGMGMYKGALVVR